MQSITGQLAYLDASAAVLFILIGLVYGLFGWRLVRFLVILDSLAVAALCVVCLSRYETIPYVNIPALPAALMSVFILPLLAWRFPEKAVLMMSGLAGFACVQLFLMDFDLPQVVLLVLGALGAGLAMALAITMSRQTTVVITGLHGGWLCVGALAIVAVNRSNFIGEMLNSFSHSFALVTPAAAIAFSAILIFLQWSDMQGHTAQN